MLQLHLGKLRLVTTLWALSTGVAATTTGCSKDENASSGTLAAPAEAEIFAMGEAYELQTLLLASKTRLELTQAEFLSLNSLLPASLTALAEGLVPAQLVGKVWIKDGEDLMRFTLTEPGYKVQTPTGELALAQTVAVQRIVQPDAMHAMHVITVTGMTFAGQPVQYLYLLKDGTLRFGFADQSEKSAEVPTLKQLFQNPESVIQLPTSSQVVRGLFAGTFALRTAAADNVAHVKVPAEGNQFVKLVKEQLAASNADPRLLELAGRITDIYVDKTGIQVWMKEGMTMQFQEGAATFAAYFKLSGTNASTIVPVQGVTAVAYQADGAAIQQFRFVPLSDGTARIDVDVYGWRQTLLGTFGQTQTVSFNF